MVVHHRKRLIIGLAVILVGIAIATSRATINTRLVSDAPVERRPPPTDFDVGFGTEVEERLISVDLRIPATFVIVGVGLIVSAFIHRRH